MSEGTEDPSQQLPMGPLHCPTPPQLSLGKKVLGCPGLNEVSAKPVLRQVNRSTPNANTDNFPTSGRAS